MVCFIELIISGIQKVLFPLWFAVIAVGHHQIPVYVLFHHVLGGDVYKRQAMNPPALTAPNPLARL